jgi:hypothetical protein
LPDPGHGEAADVTDGGANSAAIKAVSLRSYSLASTSLNST